MTAVTTTEKECRLKMFEQEAYPMHGHSVDGKMCVWKK